MKYVDKKCNSAMIDFDKNKKYECQLKFRHSGLHKKDKMTWDDKSVEFR